MESVSDKNVKRWQCPFALMTYSTPMHLGKVEVSPQKAVMLERLPFLSPLHGDLCGLMFNCPGMLFFPLPLWLYLDVKLLGLIPVPPSIRLFSYRPQNIQTRRILQVSTESKCEVHVSPSGMSSLSVPGRKLGSYDQNWWPLLNFSSAIHCRVFPQHYGQ